MDDGANKQMKPASPVKRFMPLAVLVAGAALFFALGLHKYVSLDVLRENRQQLAGWVGANMVLAALIYIGAYTLMVAFSVPGALVGTLTGGFLFGTVTGGLLTVVGATVGAALVFLAAKTALGDALRARAGPGIKKMEQGFQENAFSYLLVLRLVPLFPFVLVNLAPAFLGVRLSTFVGATFLGIVPGTFVFASLGNGLGAIFDRGEDPDLSLVTEPEILAPILGLAVLAAIPIVYKRFFAPKKHPKAGVDVNP